MIRSLVNHIEKWFVTLYPSRRFTQVLIFGLILLVALSAAAIINLLNNYVENARRAELHLYQIRQSAYQQSALEWQAIAEEGLSDELAHDFAALQLKFTAIFNQLALLSETDAAITPVLRAYEHYQAAITQEFHLLALGQIDQAKSIDEELVDPSFKLLHDAIEKSIVIYSHEARAVSQQALYGSIMTLFIAICLIGVFFWRFEKIRRTTTILLTEQETLRHSEERFRSLVRNAADIILISDIQGLIHYVSPAVVQILGYAAESLVTQSSLALIHPDDRPQLTDFMQAIINCKEPCRCKSLRVRHRDGSWRFFELIGTNLLDSATINGIVFNAHDVTERKLAEARLNYQAFHDHLTHLPNRAHFLASLEDAFQSNMQNDHGVVLLFLDLDNFNVINDSLGHEVGDQLLLAVTKRFAACLRPGDRLARLAGDEFTILLKANSLVADAFQLAERIHAQLQSPIQLNSYEVFTSVSIGIAENNPEIHTAGDLMRIADVALYHAKAGGKSKSVLFVHAMHVQAMARLTLEAELRRALEQRQLCVFYQPIVAIASKTIIGMEALARWPHPARGMISPAEFIPLAEETGLIIPLGRQIMQMASQQMTLWQELHPAMERLRLNVNLSTRQFRHPHLIEEISNVLQASGLQPCQLEIEITESLLLEETDRVRVLLYALKDLGLRLALDDFGTGYSSLAYLHRFPFDTLKIDRSFVNALNQKPGSANVIRAIKLVAQSLNLELIVEGVETEAQYTFLRSLDCDYGQGYYFARPQAPAAFTDFSIFAHQLTLPKVETFLAKNRHLVRDASVLSVV